MKTKNKKILIGVAWPYVNGDLHPGHIAGCYLPADIFARFNRLSGNDVLMVSGCDSFGSPITIQAEKEGVTPKEIVDKYVPRTSNLLLDKYKISFDSFTKTDTELHRRITQEFFINLAKSGFIIKKKSQQYFSESENKFLPDRYVQGECSFCHAKQQRGDQCEVCGRSLQVGELINPYASLDKSPVSLKETEHYFVDLAQFKGELTDYINSRKEIWRTWVWKEAKAWIDELQPRAITRDIYWGVEIPQDELPEELRISGAENKRFYVWFDAVIGYFSEGIKFVANNGKDKLDPILSDTDEAIYEFINKYWRSDDENLKHYLFVGKDNLFFHTLWWQSLLIGQKHCWFGENTVSNSLKNSLKLPDNVPVNQFLNLEGQKFSKSRGIYIDCTRLVDEFGLDAIRFYLASIMPENSDANWKWNDFVTANNNELAANIGNFIHRTLTFYQNKLIPFSDEKKSLFSPYQELSDPSVISKISEIFKDYSNAITGCEFSKSLNHILELGKFGNKYFNDKEPWKSLKENQLDCEKTIYNCLQIVNALRILLNPFCPDASNRLSEMIGLTILPSKPNQNIGINYFEFDQNDISGISINNELLQPLFKKIEPEQLEEF